MEQISEKVMGIRCLNSLELSGFSYKKMYNLNQKEKKEKWNCYYAYCLLLLLLFPSLFLPYLLSFIYILQPYCYLTYGIRIYPK